MSKAGIKKMSNELLYSAIATYWMHWLPLEKPLDPPWDLYQEFIDRYRAGTWDCEYSLSAKDRKWIKRGLFALHTLV